MLFACGSDDTPRSHVDAGSPDAADASSGPEWLSPPAEAALPVLVPCPPGWRERAETDLVVCEPWPETGRQECSGADAHLPGRAGCAPIGRACPAGEFADDLPPDAPALYVRAGAVDGDGTRERPFGTIGAALARSAGGYVIAVAKGHYDEMVDARPNVRIQGACAAETVIAPSLGSGTARDVAVRVVVAGAAIHDVTVRAGARYGIGVGSTASLHLDGVVVSGVTGVGLLIDGGTLTARGLIVRDVSPFADGTFGRGISAQGGTVDVVEAAIERVHDIGVFAGRTGAVLRLSDAVVTGTRAAPGDPAAGIGLKAQEGATMELTRVVAEDNRSRAIGGISGSTLRVDQCVARGARQALAGDQIGAGIALNSGASGEVRRSWIDDCRGAGLVADDTATSLHVEDVVVLRTLPVDADPDDTAGFVVSGGAAVTGARLAVAENQDLGVVIARNRSADLSDVFARDNVAAPYDPSSGNGILVDDGVGTLARVRLERNHFDGMALIGPAARMIVTDLVVRDTRAPPEDYRSGRGITVENGASLEITRAILEDNVEIGLIAFGGGARLSAEDLLIARTRPRVCPPERNPCYAAGIGAVAVDASVELRRFVIQDSPQCGAQLARGGTIDLHTGVVERNAIGACIQDPTFDVARLQDDVAFRDNTTNIDATTLPVPEPSVP